MRQQFYSICIIAMIYMFQSCNAQVNNSILTKSVDKHATEFLQDARVTSVSVNIYVNGNYFSKHYGELTKGKGNTPTDNALYEIGSVSKTMTGYLVAKAVKDKKFALSDPISKFLGADYKNLSFQGNPITIQHLLTHTSGFPLNINGIDALHAQGTKAACEKAQRILATYTKDSFLTTLKDIRIDHAPGVQYGYSNVTPNVLAHILEVIYEKPFDVLLNEFLFEPAEMHNTAINLSKEQQLLFAHGYNDRGELMPNYQKPIQLWGAAGRVKSNSHDLLKYMKFQLQESNPIVKETHSKLFRDFENLWIGYFWEIIEDGTEKRIEHHGGLYGTQNWMILYPEHNLGISIVTNASFPETSQLLKTTATHIINDILN